MKTGKAGENTAENYLKKEGYKVVERNFRCRCGEIDLIVERNNIIAFVEVKTRNSLKYGVPSESITPAKVRHIRLAAHWYITAGQRHNDDLDYRFDVMEILRLNGKQYVNHIESAF